MFTSSHINIQQTNLVKRTTLLDCIVIGDIFVDLIAHVGPNFDQSFYGGTSYSDSIRMELGGSGNVAVGLSMLEASVAFVGKAGHDLFGKLYVENLNKKRIVHQVFIDKHSPTGSIFVFVHDRNERSFLVYRGANDKLSNDEIEQVDNLIRNSEFLYVCGFSLVNDPQRSAILHAIELSRKHNRRVVFDPGAHNIIRSEPKLFAEIFDLCDVFTPNLDEALAFTNTKNLDEAIIQFEGKGPMVALKCGEQGCVLISEGSSIKIPVHEVTCLDPTGAGDAFAAALIYGLTHKLSLHETGVLANWFSSQVVRKNGARSFPTKYVINRFFENQNSFHQ